MNSTLLINCKLLKSFIFKYNYIFLCCLSKTGLFKVSINFFFFSEGFYMFTCICQVIYIFLFTQFFEYWMLYILLTILTEKSTSNLCWLENSTSNLVSNYKIHVPCMRFWAYNFLWGENFALSFFFICTTIKNFRELYLKRRYSIFARKSVVLHGIIY